MKNFKLLFLFFACLTCNPTSAFSFQSPTGIVTDIFEIQIDALDNTTNKALDSLLSSIAGNVKASMAVENFNPTENDLKNHNLLKKTVDSIYDNNKGRFGTTVSLGKISKAIDIKDDIKKIKKLTNIPKSILRIAKNADEISKNLSKLIQNDRKGVVLRNIRKYGSGKREGKMTALLQDIDSENYKALYEIATELNNVDQNNKALASQVFNLIFKETQQNIASELSEQLKSEAGIKKYIQDQVVATWINSGVPKTEHDLLVQNTYRLIKNEGFFRDSYESFDVLYNNVYDGSLASEDTFSNDFLLEGNYFSANTTIEKDGEPTYLSGSEEGPEVVIKAQEAVYQESAAEKRAREKVLKKLNSLKNNLNEKALKQISQQENLNRIDTKLNSTNRRKDGYDQMHDKLSNKKNDLEHQLSQIESQLSQRRTNTNHQRKTDINKLERYLEAYRYSESLYNKYNGDISKITWEEKRGLYRRSRLVLKSPKHYKTLFKTGRLLANTCQDQLDRYRTSSVPNGNKQELERQRSNLINEIRKVTSDLRTAENNLSSFSRSIKDLQTEQRNTSAQYEVSRKNLIDLASDIQDLQKEQQAALPTTTSTPVYTGHFAAISNDGWTKDAQVKTNNPQERPYVGMELQPWSEYGVYLGQYNIATLHTSDSYGNYSYMSWGRWDGTNPPQRYIDLDGTGTTFAGGTWFIGSAIKNIPQQGSAKYLGDIEGDYRGPSNIREEGVISGTITLNSNFSNASLTGNVNIFRNGTPLINSALTNGRIDLQSGIFATDIQGADNGSVNGQFGGIDGTIPTEAGGGIWYEINNSHGIEAIFHAKQQ